MDLTLKEETTRCNKLDVFKDPFDKGSVERIMFVLHPKGGYMYSDVKFVNGKTTGRQEINADDFNTLVEATKEFIDSLEKEVKNG